MKNIIALRDNKERQRFESLDGGIVNQVFAYNRESRGVVLLTALLTLSEGIKKTAEDTVSFIRKAGAHVPDVEPFDYTQN